MEQVLPHELMTTSHFATDTSADHILSSSPDLQRSAARGLRVLAGVLSVAGVGAIAWWVYKASSRSVGCGGQRGGHDSGALLHACPADVAAYENGGLAGGAHGWSRVYGLLRPQQTAPADAVGRSDLEYCNDLRIATPSAAPHSIAITATVASDAVPSGPTLAFHSLGTGSGAGADNGSALAGEEAEAATAALRRVGTAAASAMAPPRGCKPTSLQSAIAHLVSAARGSAAASPPPPRSTLSEGALLGGCSDASTAVIADDHPILVDVMRTSPSPSNLTSASDAAVVTTAAVVPCLNDSVMGGSLGGLHSNYDIGDAAGSIATPSVRSSFALEGAHRATHSRGASVHSCATNTTSPATGSVTPHPSRHDSVAGGGDSSIMDSKSSTVAKHLYLLELRRAQQRRSTRALRLRLDQTTGADSDHHSCRVLTGTGGDAGCRTDDCYGGVVSDITTGVPRQRLGEVVALTTAEAGEGEGDGALLDGCGRHSRRRAGESRSQQRSSSVGSPVHTQPLRSADFSIAAEESETRNSTVAPRGDDVEPSTCIESAGGAALPHNRSNPSASSADTQQSITASPKLRAGCAASLAPSVHAADSQDRRVDDLRVRHKEGSAMYSISLTYHDIATGASRTVDARALPPLTLPPRQKKAPGSGAVTVAAEVDSTSRGVMRAERTPASSQCTHCAETLRHWSTEHPSSTQSVEAHAEGRTERWRSDFRAPLPPTEPTSGPRLQGVAGRRGEMVIGAFLGGGACGKVYECLNTESGLVLAAKQIVFDAKDPKLRHRLKQLELELEVLTLAARHDVKWIVGFHGAEKRGHSMLMYLEYCEHGSLLDYMANGNSHDAPLWPGTAPPPTLTSTPAANADEVVAQPSKQRLSYPDEETVITSPPSNLSSLQQQSADAEPAILSISLPPAAPASSLARLCIPAMGSHDVPCTTPTRSNTACSTPRGLSSNTSSTGVSVLTDVMRPQMVPLSMEEIQRFTRQIVLGLHFLHSHAYAHLDVKTANVLMTAAEECRLADLGCAMRMRMPSTAVPGRAAGSRASGTSGLCSCNIHREGGGGGDASSNSGHGDECTATANDDDNEDLSYPVLMDPEAVTELRGTALYMAPEVIRFEREKIGSPADVWSLGCVVMEMASGSAPWRHIARDKLRVLFRIGSARTELPLPPLLRLWADEAREWLASNDGMDDCEGVSVEEPVHSFSFASLPGSDGEPLRKRRHMERGASDLSGPAACTLATHRWRMRQFIALEDFVQQCVRIRPEDRSSIASLLHHPFLKTHDSM